MLRNNPSVVLILALLVQESTSFSTTSTHVKETRLFAKAAKNIVDGPADEPSIDLAAPKPASSDLRALLPKPSSRPLKLDKFGRRGKALGIVIIVLVTECYYLTTLHWSQ